ncbi:FAS1 domain-containing protein [Microdochium trichocladiopsis]|uniref:FAS1 domain-containing protein n=1 Tax=Microdochium trichocladiopsis TaxID=1682393 RepID=A0A9P9BP27_9PEZI|nr:FAS1 domain-containing protein [Microdochium trichocladiopsis]KAH7032694.1 FAS1 domain-containing protein [Microdochium trichocladiopsis]
MQIRQSLFLAAAGRAVAQQLPSLTEALASQNETLSTLISLISNNTAVSQSIGQLSNITILAPNNEALNSLISNADPATAMMLAQPDFIQAVLSYHILNGTYYGSNFTETAAFVPTALTNETYTNVTGGQRVEGVVQDGNVVLYSGLRLNSTVVTANLNFTGGVIHIIDSVLTIPGSIPDTLTAANLTALAGAVGAADLGDALTDLQNVTIFAPSNDAFGAIGSITGNLSTEALAGILQYHVVDGVLGYSSGLSDTTLTALDGSELNIRVIDGEVFVNSAKVVIPDVLVANGVVHVIDQVLNPSAALATPNPSATTTTPAFSGASSTTGVPFTSNAATPSSTVPAASTSGVPRPTGAAAPMKTGAVGAAALFGGAAVLMNM